MTTFSGKTNEHISFTLSYPTSDFHFESTPLVSNIKGRQKTRATERSSWAPLLQHVTWSPHWPLLHLIGQIILMLRCYNWSKSFRILNIRFSQTILLQKYFQRHHVNVVICLPNHVFSSQHTRNLIYRPHHFLRKLATIYTGTLLSEDKQGQKAICAQAKTPL